MAQDTGCSPRSSPTTDSRMVLDPSLHYTQYYKVWVKGTVQPSRESFVTIEKGAFCSPATMVVNFIYIYIYIYIYMCVCVCVCMCVCVIVDLLLRRIYF